MGELKSKIDEPSLDNPPIMDDDDADDVSEAAEYVQELIRRMGGDPTSLSPQPEPEPDPEPENVEGNSDDAAETNEAVDDLSLPIDNVDADLEAHVQTVVAKSRMIDSRDALNKFREAANLTAKDAFQKFSNKRLIERAYIWLFLTFFFLINALVARYMEFTQSETIANVLNFSMGLSVLAALRYVWLTSVVNRGLIRSR